MSKERDAFSKRIKGYEFVSESQLVKKVPVLCRVDQRSGSRFTRGLKKPIDGVYAETMKRTMRDVAGEVMGCVYGYTQSDEITYVITDYASIDTESFFGYRVQKMVSVIASMTTRYFNKNFREVVGEYKRKDKLDTDLEVYESKFDEAEFDSRVFNVPKEDLVNAVYWRQKDAERNSVSGLGQANYPHKELMGIGNEELKRKLKEEKGLDWESQSADRKWGSSCYKESYTKECKDGEEITRSRWVMDEDMPLLLGDGREHLARWL